MATYNRPGVYVNELPLTAAPITGATAANAAGAVIAAFAQGPDTVTLVTSWYDFVKTFGGYNATYPATFSVGSFFKNGGTELYVKRVLPNAARKVAKVDIYSDAASISALTVSKASKTGTTATITTTATHNLEVGDTVTVAGLTDYVTASVSKASKTGTTATITTAATHNLVVGDVVTIAGLTDDTGGSTTTDWTVFNKVGAVITAVNAGAKTFAYTVTTSGTVAEATPAGTGTVAGVAWTVFNKVGAVVTEVNASAKTFSYTVTTSGTVAESTPQGSGTVNGSSADVVMTIAAKHRGLDGNNLRVKFSASRAVRQPGYYDLTVYQEAGVLNDRADDVIVEQFTGLVIDDPTSGDYITTVLDFNSGYVKVLEGAETEYNNDGTTISPVVTYSINTAFTPRLDTVFPLAGAPTPEGALTYLDYTGNAVFDPSDLTPEPFNVDDCELFKEFEIYEQPLVFFLPDVISKIAATANGAVVGWDLAQYVYNALIEWVESPNTGGRNFVIVETSAAASVDTALSESGALTETSRAAVYYPHVYIKDPIGRSGASIRKVGPSGAVAGLYLYTDRLSGPFKAPAGIGTKITDAIALERAFSSKDLDNLNTGVDSTNSTDGNNVVNAVRNIPGAGVVVMGGRTLKQDGTANRYVSMRRSLTYIETRLKDIAGFAVFENNTEILWARLITALGAFLNEYRNQGGLRGTTVDESFYIKCDNENNTAGTIQAGEVHIEVGVALEYPAEFVVINLSQKTAE
jgi:hypothetical protein